MFSAAPPMDRGETQPERRTGGDSGIRRGETHSLDDYRFPTTRNPEGETSPTPLTAEDRATRDPSRVYSIREVDSSWQKDPPKTEGEEAARHRHYPQAEDGYHYKVGKSGEPVYSLNPSVKGERGENKPQRDFYPEHRVFMNKKDTPDIRAIIQRGDLLKLSEQSHENGDQQAIRREMNEIFKEREKSQRLRDEYLQKQKQELPGSSDAGKTDIKEKAKEAQNSMTDASRQLGEKASEYYAKSQNWARVFPPHDHWPSQSGEFDVIYKEKRADGTDKYIAVEAKGGAEKYNELGVRKVDGVLVEQGTREYFDAILKNMRGKSMEDTNYAIANTLKNADIAGDVEYIRVKANIIKGSDGKETFDNIQIDRFVI